MPVTFADIAAEGASRSTAEAVGLALAAIHACEEVPRADQCLALPDAEHIVLSRHGHVSFSVPPAEDADPVKQVAGLLRRLLGLDREPAVERADVPGALLLLLARASGQIDLPAPSYVALREVLARFGSPDAMALSSIHDRVVRRHGIGSVFSARAAVAASLAAAAVVLAFAVIWNRQPTTDTAAAGDAVTVTAGTGDAVTVETVAVRVPIDASQLSAASHIDPAQPQPASTRALLSLGTDVFSPSFAQEDRVLVFHAGRNRSALMRATFDPAGTPAVATVLRDGAANYHATVSPDGTSLAYDSDRDGTRAVYVSHADGSGARKISGEGYAAVPRWSPDGRRLAFAKAEVARPGVWNVWVADLATGTISRVSRHKVGQAWGASWFPDGTRIAYSVEDTLVLANLADGSTRVLSTPRRGRLVRTPAVSPDGKRIVFQVHRDGAWLLDVTTGSMRRVLNDAAAEEFAWSSDGRRVVFHTRHKGAWSVWQLQLDPAAG